MEHIARNCPTTRREVECYNCNKMGHIARDCLEEKAGNPDVQCYNCKDMGHFARDCTYEPED